MYDLNGKVALVTGTSNKRGIGCGIALRLAREGADVVVTDKFKAAENFSEWEKEEGWRGIDSLAIQIEALGRQSLAVPADITSSKEVNEMVQKAFQKFGKIDILINNAGISRGAIGLTPLIEMSEDLWNKPISVNMTGTFLVTKAVMGDMIKRRTGKIINIASSAGKIGKEKLANYCASKFGVVGFTQSLALELAPYNINVNAVCPAGTATMGGKGGQDVYKLIKQGLSEEEAINKIYCTDQFIPLGRVGRVEDIANMVVFLVSSQADYVTGQAINVCGGRVIAH